MKKHSFFIFLASGMFLTSVMAFASEADVKEATDPTSAVMETSKNLSTEARSKANSEIVGESKAAPIATVSGVEKAESPVSTAKAETDSSKASSLISSTKKAAEVQEKTENALNSAEMQKRWKALFSKDIAADSISYTVKPGDSLYVLARKNHTTVDFIKKINGLKGDNIYPKMKLKIHTAPFSILVDKSKNTLVLYSKDVPVKKYSVATGKKNCTPVGEFKIADKLVHPTWFKTGAILPPGSPENALGTRWMGFDKPAYGIHGTIEPKSIGTQASEGCIRMLNEEVEELYSIVPVGTKVTIQD